MSRLDEICRAAWPECESTLTHESWHLPLVARILTAALEAAEASPQLTDRWLRAACEQARERTETP